jgi:hypothetical protein
VVKKVETSDMDTRYLKYEEHECVKVYEECLEKWTLMNAGIPHRVKNGAVYRLCVSIPLLDLNTGNQIQFNDALRRFEKYVRT